MKLVGNKVRGVAICLSLLCAGAAVGAEKTISEQARAWLEKMSRAVHSQSYDGTFIYLHGSEVQTVRVIRSIEGEDERERMVLLNGVPREVVRSNDKITYIIPRNRSLVLERGRDHPQTGFPQVFPRRIDKLMDCYDVSLTGRDRVVGRDTQRITIRPKDKLRYGYRLWLDSETGLLLKSMLLGNQGQGIEQFMFTSLRFLDEVPSALLEPEFTGNEFVLYKDRPDEDGNMQAGGLWYATELPYGFELSTHRSYSSADSQDAMEQFVYSDGLSSVSVFIEPLNPKQKPLRGRSSMGVVNAFGIARDNYQVIALGEVPAATVQQIATSIQRRAEGAGGD